MGGTHQSEADDDSSDLHQAFVDFNLDRKVSMPDKLKMKFALKNDTQKIGKYKCWVGNQPGHFYVTTYDICWLGSFGKKFQHDLATLKEVKKAKRFKMTPEKGHSIHIVEGNGSSHEYNAFSQRDDCFKLLADQCHKLGAATVFTEE